MRHGHPQTIRRGESEYARGGMASRVLYDVRFIVPSPFHHFLLPFPIRRPHISFPLLSFCSFSAYTRPLTFYVDVRRHKFWNVKMSSTRRPSSNVAPDSASESSKHGAQEEEPWVEEEWRETAQSIKDKQSGMEEQVLRIWTCVHPLSFPTSRLLMGPVFSRACVGSYLHLKSRVQHVFQICYGMSAIASTSRRFGTRKCLSCTSRYSLRLLMIWSISSPH